MEKRARSILVSARAIQVAGDFGGGYRNPSASKSDLLHAIIYCSPLGELGGSILGAEALLSSEERVALRKQGWMIPEPRA